MCVINLRRVYSTSPSISCRRNNKISRFPDRYLLWPLPERSTFILIGQRGERILSVFTSAMKTSNNPAPNLSSRCRLIKFSVTVVRKFSIDKSWKTKSVNGHHGSSNAENRNNFVFFIFYQKNAIKDLTVKYARIWVSAIVKKWAVTSEESIKSSG